MAETVQSMEGLASLKPAAPESPKYVQKLDAQGRAYATGKRKNAVARVWIKPGSGKILVNTKTVEAFFADVDTPSGGRLVTFGWAMAEDLAGGKLGGR